MSTSVGSPPATVRRAAGAIASSTPSATGSPAGPRALARSTSSDGGRFSTTTTSSRSSSPTATGRWKVSDCARRRAPGPGRRIATSRANCSAIQLAGASSSSGAEGDASPAAGSGTGLAPASAKARRSCAVHTRVARAVSPTAISSNKRLPIAMTARLSSRHVCIVTFLILRGGRGHAGFSRR
jgi:hypothetical protein